jgi:hypothetical protein
VLGNKGAAWFENRPRQVSPYGVKLIGRAAGVVRGDLKAGGPQAREGRFGKLARGGRKQAHDRHRRAQLRMILPVGEVFVALPVRRGDLSPGGGTDREMAGSTPTWTSGAGVVLSPDAHRH